MEIAACPRWRRSTRSRSRRSTTLSGLSDMPPEIVSSLPHYGTTVFQQRAPIHTIEHMHRPSSISFTHAHASIQRTGKRAAARIQAKPRAPDDICTCGHAYYRTGYRAGCHRPKNRPERLAAPSVAAISITCEVARSSSGGLNSTRGACGKW